jgi:glucokinase
VIDESHGIHTLGLDIGGTKTTAVVVDGPGRVVSQLTVPTPALDGSSAVLAAALAVGLEAAAGHSIAAVGVGAAGVIDSELGTVLSATSSLPGWAGTRLRAAFDGGFPGVPVAVLGDVQAFALAEATLGAAVSQRIVLGVTVGTGIGGALLIDGRLIHGAHSAAGHLGHVSVAAAAGLPCPCGRSGHVEAIASGPAMTGAFRAAGGTAADLPAVVEAARAGDDRASRILQAGIDALGEAIGSVANLLDPDVVVIGGGVSRLGEPWLEGVRAAALRFTIPAIGAVRLERGLLGAHSAAIGAAVAAAQLQRQTVGEPR